MGKETVLHGDLGGGAARLAAEQTIRLQHDDTKAARTQQVRGEDSAYAAADDAYVAGSVAFERLARAGRWGVGGQKGFHGLASDSCCCLTIVPGV